MARVCIDTSGRVSTIKIMRGMPLFDEAVMNAVRSWRYEPYRPGRSAVPACFPVYFNFNLKE